MDGCQDNQWYLAFRGSGATNSRYSDFASTSPFIPSFPSSDQAAQSPLDAHYTHGALQEGLQSLYDLISHFPRLHTSAQVCRAELVAARGLIVEHLAHGFLDRLCVLL